MAGKDPFEIMAAGAREAERSRRKRDAEQRKSESEGRRKERDLERLLKAHSPDTKNTAPARKRIRGEAMLQAAADMNAELKETVDGLETLLGHALKIDDAIDFATLMINAPFDPGQLPADLGTELPVPILDAYLGKVKPKSLLERATRSLRFERDAANARKAYSAGMVTYHESYLDRQARLAKHRAGIDAARIAYGNLRAQREADVEALRSGYERLDPGAVRAYFAMVLERSRYPEGFPQEFRLSYDAAAKELAIGYLLPGIGIVPAVGGYHYIKTRDAIEPKARSKHAVRLTYQRILAGAAIRSLHEVFEADRAGAIAAVSFNGHIETIDKATGRGIKPCVVSVRAEREAFLGMVLANVDVLACLRGLGGNLSSKPEVPLAVNPAIPFVPTFPSP